MPSNTASASPSYPTIACSQNPASCACCRKQTCRRWTASWSTPRNSRTSRGFTPFATFLSAQRSAGATERVKTAGSADPSSEQPVLPGLRRLLVNDLEIDMILEVASAALPDRVDHVRQTRVEIDRRLVLQQLPRFVGRARGVFDFLRPPGHEDGIEIELKLVGDSLGEFDDRDRLLVRADIDDLADDVVAERHLLQAVETVVDERKAALLLTVPINNGLASLQHQIDHDRRHIAERIIPFLSGTDNVVGARNQVLDAAGAAYSAQNVLSGELADSVGVLRLRLLVLGEGRLEGAVARHRRAEDDSLRAIGDRCGENRHGGADDVLRHEMGRENRQAFISSRCAMIIDVAAVRHLLDVIEVVAIELVKINLRRDIVEFPADQVIDPDNVMSFGEHRVSQMAAEKPRDPRNEHLHR